MNDDIKMLEAEPEEDVEPNDSFYFCDSLKFAMDATKLNDVCAICKDPKHENEIVTPCGHLFHIGCLTEWFASQPRCPFCSKVIAIKIE
jgi:hypothetical protein